MARGLLDTFPWPPETFPGNIRWFPGPFLIEILIFWLIFSKNFYRFLPENEPKVNLILRKKGPTDYFHLDVILTATF